MPAALLTNRSLSEPPSVLIVGAGIAGLALGRALRARGISAEIIERTTAWTPAGTGIYLPANGVRALQSLGIGDAVTSRSVRMTYQRILDNRGRLLAEVDLDAVWGAVGPCVGMRRADLHSMLLDGAHGVPLRLGTTVTALTESHDAVTVVFDDGVQREYDVVVGADGVHSTIRRLAFGSTPPNYVGQVSWRFLSEHTHGITNWTVMLDRRRAFLTVPVPGGLYCYADLRCERIERAESDITLLRSFFPFRPPPPYFPPHTPMAKRKKSRDPTERWPIQPEVGAVRVGHQEKREEPCTEGKPAGTTVTPME